MIRVSASKLKAKLGRYMRAVREGKVVLITDRDQPVARLTPFRPQAEAAVRVTQARDPMAPPLGAVTVRSIRARGVDTARLLAEDRARR